MRREPRLFGHPQSRWTLDAIAETCDWLRTRTQAGVWQVLDRLGVTYKRGRSYIHSPDPYYDVKLSMIQLHLLRAWYQPENYVFLYLDELTYYRQPSLARAYEYTGHCQALAQRSCRSDNQFRIVAALNAITGQVTYRQHSKIGLSQLSNFYAAIRADYPTATEIDVAQDNWPIHFHPDILVRLQPQTFIPGPPKLSPKWPSQPSSKAIRDCLPIRLLMLPTYASWLNPIEKLWRWLKQNVLHLHRLSDDWQALKGQVTQFLDTLTNGSPDLLRYVGLLPN